jgi:CRP-like cAMP-binding protein
MCTPELLADFRLLASLSPEHLEAVAATARSTTIEEGKWIIVEGHEADRCWLIRSGLVGLETRMPTGKARTVQTLGDGDVLGWSWLVPPHKWRFDAVALTQVSAVELDAAQLRELADRDSSFGYAIALRLVEALGDRLHGTRARLIDLYGSPRGE